MNTDCVTDLGAWFRADPDLTEDTVSENELADRLEAEAGRDFPGLGALVREAASALRTQAAPPEEVRELVAVAQRIVEIADKQEDGGVWWPTVRAHANILAQDLAALLAGAPRTLNQPDEIGPFTVDEVPDSFNEGPFVRDGEGLVICETVNTDLARMIANALNAAGAPPTHGDALRTTLAADLAEMEVRIARGKGTWPEPGYVRDETWAGWQGELYALRRLARVAAAGAPPKDAALPCGGGCVLDAGHAGGCHAPIDPEPAPQELLLMVDTRAIGEQIELAGEELAAEPTHAPTLAEYEKRCGMN